MAAKLKNYLAVQYSLFRRLHHIDALYIRCHPAALIAVALARLFRVPTVLEINGAFDDVVLAYPAMRRVFPLLKAALRLTLKSGTALVAVTEGLRNWALGQAGNKPAFVVPNGVNTELFRPGARQNPVVVGDYAVFVGTLTRWQGLDTLIEAITQPSWPPQLKLVIVGDGAERARVENAARRIPTLVYAGRKPQTEVAAIIASSVAGLSIQNNMMNRSDKGLCPLKVFETLACGVPAIVSDFPGQADVVRQHRCGLVIPAGDATGLGRALQYLYANPGVRMEMGTRGRELAVSQCSWDNRACAVDHILSVICHA
jgi:glycosyltransferase involved in cell wall biosynthesis